MPVLSFLIFSQSKTPLVPKSDTFPLHPPAIYKALQLNFLQCISGRINIFGLIIFFKIYCSDSRELHYIQHLEVGVLILPGPFLVEMTIIPLVHRMPVLLQCLVYPVHGNAFHIAFHQELRVIRGPASQTILVKKRAE